MAHVMTTWLALLLGCTLAVAASAPCASAQTSAADPAIQAKIAAAVEQERHTYGGRALVPGVLVGVWDGAGRTYVHAFGDADLATHRALTPDDHFRIGSNTKTFVISVLLQLVDEGKLGLDDPLSRFSLGVTVPNAEHITVRELCQMRSGLFEAYDAPEIDQAKVTPDSKWDPRTLIGWAVKQKPYFPPGTAYKYSNTNYLLLGLIIESVTKDTVEDQIAKRLLIPFHLTHTSYPATQAMPDPWAHGYGLDKQRGWEDVSNTIPVSLMGAAGEMISDMADSKRWVELYVGGKTSGPATQRARMDCIPTGQGNLAFGLGIGCSAGWYGYTGGLPGYNTANYTLPAAGITIVAWATLQADDPPPGVANAVFRDIARIMSPANEPFVMGKAAPSHGGLTAEPHPPADR
ncbi:MAG: beta-lactamase family protein [Acetobacteraceae bacterium]|nr:beta-lactamase family protein [Acetobacteraceae bacterium]